MSHADHDGPVFFTHTFHHRSVWGVLGVALCAVFATGILLTVPQLDGYARALPVVLSAAFLAGGVWELVAVLSDRRDRYVIDAEGVTFGDEFVPWSDVRMLYAHGWPTASGVDLVLALRGQLVAVNLNIHPRLSPADYERLVERVRTGVGGRFPELRLGGYTVS